MTESPWALDLDSDDAAAYAALASDAIWNGYGIADLVPPYRAYTRVALARRGGALATCVIVQHPAFTSLIPSGDAEGLGEILAATHLPGSAMILTPDALLAVVSRWYAFATPPRLMARMAVTPDHFQSYAGPVQPTRVTLVDAPALQAFYATHGDFAFTGDLLASGPFYIVLQAGEILAAGGTHALAAQYGIGAVGAILTRPDARGRGYASAVTAAITRDQFTEGARTVILNVIADNAPARHVYQRLGYQDYCPFREGQATRYAVPGGK